MYSYLNPQGQSDCGHHAGGTQETDQWNSATEVGAGVSDQEEECSGAGECHSAGEGVSVWSTEGVWNINHLTRYSLFFCFFLQFNDSTQIQWLIHNILPLSVPVFLIPNDNTRESFLDQFFWFL